MEWLELLVHIRPRNSEAAVIPLLDEACVHELADEVGCRITLLAISLQHRDLYLQGVILSDLGRALLFFEELCLLLLLDLLLRATPLAAGLQKVR